jgi:small subunit ribosomal protein S1
MSENFADLFEESLKTIEMHPGAIITGVVLDIDNDWVTVHAGLKSEGVIPRNQFFDENGELTVSIGDMVQVALETVEDGFGETKLSREKAKRAESWKMLEEAHESQEIVTGIINGKVKGGFTVEVNSIRAFLPGSLVDVRPIRDTSHLEGKPLELKVIKLDEKRNNVVVSRRAVMETTNDTDRAELLEALDEGSKVTGVIKNLTDYGAFVDLGGVDGLLHITDMAWKRIKHPSEIVNVGEEIEVKVLKFDREKNRVSLGLKQLGEDPWGDIKNRYPTNSIAKGVITNLTDYGCFAELETGVEGLVHVSEMDWTNKNVHPSKIINLGDEVDVMILEIDEERRRISLGIKQCQPNPWDLFGSQHSKGDKISGTIKSITDFGIFIGLEGNIDGLVHLSDISWTESGEEAKLKFSKGDEVETIILAIDSERERISLGIKQLTEDPFVDFVSENGQGKLVKGTVKSLDAKSAVISVSDGIEGILKVSEVAQEKVDDIKNVLSEGDELELKVLSVDRKNHSLSLSLKAKEQDEEKEVIRKHREEEQSSTPTNTIGGLIKAKMDDK